ncbi:MAG: hypothetical protein Q9220_006576 [cf. Caloplaca sp. 1 TL-2023]
MPQPPNVFAGGWSADKAAKTRCKVCRKFKTIANYSNKQQIELRQRIAGPNGEKAKSPRCFLCVHEHITAPWADKDLKPEVSDDGGTEDDDEDEFTETASRTHTTVSNPYERDTSTLASMLKASNLSEHDKAYGLPENKKGSTALSQSEYLMSFSEHKGGPSDTKGKGKDVEYTGWDSQGGSHRRRREPSSVYSDGVEIEVDPDVQGLGPSKPNQVSNNRGFAKVNKGYGMPAPKHPLIEQLKAKGTGRTVSYSDDEESDSEDDYMKA